MDLLPALPHFSSCEVDPEGANEDNLLFFGGYMHGP